MKWERKLIKEAKWTRFSVFSVQEKSSWQSEKYIQGCSLWWRFLWWDDYDAELLNYLWSGLLLWGREV